MNPNLMKVILLTCLLAFTGLHGIPQKRTIQERLGYPPNAKLLIIHADDVGVSHAENTATISAMEKGCVNSASIMVPCPWFPEIAAYAKAHPQADLGLHITLTSEWKLYKWGPVTPHAKVPGLVNDSGFLYPDAESVKAAATAAEVEEEIRNQVKRAIRFGINPTHLDAHMFTALSRYDYFKAYRKVGREFNIPVFIPRGVEALYQVNFDTVLDNRDVQVDNVVTATPQDFVNIKEFYRKSFKNIQPGLTYYIIHTALDNDEMRAVTIDHPDWGSAWRQHEYDFFSSGECARLLKENNIILVTWREIRDKITRK